MNNYCEEMASGADASPTAHADVYSTDSSDDSESDTDDACENDVNSGVPLSLVDDISQLLQPSLGETACEAIYGESEGESGKEDDEDETQSPTHQLSEDTEFKGVKKKKRKKKRLWTICLANCKYDVVKKMSKKFGFREVMEEEDWTLYWTDFSVNLDRVMEMKRYQKINHFPGMTEICRKDLLARNLNRLIKQFPKEYNVFPKTWCLPADYGDFHNYTRSKKNKTYILKPESSCQGKGIWVTKNPRDIRPTDHMICQQYISKPFLIDGFKFDLRVYTLVTSCDPLRIFVFKEGLARFATAKYQEPSNTNTDNMFMHLTNYAINKHSNQFIRDEEKGSKRRLTTMNRWLERKNYDVDKLWRDIDDIIIKTIISSHSILKHNYRTCFPNHIKTSACFEILGYDIMFDKKLKPYVLEVNHSPSFTTDSDLDREIKSTLIYDSLNLVNFAAVDKKKCIEEERKRIKERLFQKGGKKESKEDLEAASKAYIQQLDKYERSHMGNFRRIYPTETTEKYDKFFHTSGSLFQETAAFKARVEMARQQREELLRKQEKLDEMRGKKTTSVMRPESPGVRKKRVRRPPHHSRGHQKHGSDDVKQNPKQAVSHTVDVADEARSSVAMDIHEDEELERISGLLQRENLVRGLGVVDHVYKLLEHVTRSLVPNKVATGPSHSKEYYDTHSTKHCNTNTNSGLFSQKRQTYYYKDSAYYQRLLNKYYGMNSVMLTNTYPNRPPTGSVNVDLEEECSSKRYPHIKLSRTFDQFTECNIQWDQFSEQNNVGCIKTVPSTVDLKTDSQVRARNALSKGSLGQTSMARQRITRRPMARTSTNLAMDSEFRINGTSASEPETGRNITKATLLDRYCESASIRHQWSVAAKQPLLGLSVISAPAPVNQRPGRVSPSSINRNRDNSNNNNTHGLRTREILKAKPLDILDKQYAVMS